MGRPAARGFSTETATATASASAAESEHRVRVSDRCVQRLREVAAARPDQPAPALRVIVDGGGCSGFQYRFELDRGGPREDDAVVERDGARVYVDAVSMPFLDGATVDYEEEMIRAAFKVDANPNSEASCSCGASFAPKL